MKRTVELSHSSVLDHLLMVAIAAVNEDHNKAARALAAAISDPDFNTQINQLENLQATLEAMEEDSSEDDMVDESEEDEEAMEEDSSDDESDDESEEEDDEKDEDEDDTDGETASLKTRRRIAKLSPRKVMARLANLK